jgi:S-adenosylmethionine:tRNA ribosyltransferase-isomerase
MRTDDFNYNLPEELIAQYPAAKRNESRMLVLDRSTGKCDIRMFSDITDYLQRGDCVVFNNTRVMNARMYGEKKDTGAKIEILLIRRVAERDMCWECLIKPGKRARIGSVICLKGKESLGEHSFSVIEKCDDGHFIIEFSGHNMDDIFSLYGHVPLPPYIKRDDAGDDFERYQTIYAKESGAVAAPTAGLHFNDEVMGALRNKGVDLQEVTLHVGPGTFKPVSVDKLTEHKMHIEEYVMPESVADKINETHSQNHRVMAVGTTAVRVIETCAEPTGKVMSGEGETDIFLYPPYKPRAVDMLLTNFHLPKSTLMMLVSTFADREKVLNAYELAIEEKMRFYSYGDCMLLV